MGSCCSNKNDDTSEVTPLLKEQSKAIHLDLSTAISASTKTSKLVNATPKDKEHPAEQPPKEPASFIECKLDFQECKHIRNVKDILHRQHARKDTNDPIFTENYSHLNLLNDFNHIKYNHHIKNEYKYAKTFNIFYNFLTQDNLMKCDINTCECVQRNYRRREEKSNEIESTTEDYGSNLLSRVHTYFLHSLEINTPTEKEINYIQQELKKNMDIESDIDNEKLGEKELELVRQIMMGKQKTVLVDKTNDNSKYITTECECLDVNIIAKIFKDFDIPIKENTLKTAFDEYDYDKNQLINDLCAGFDNKNIDDILLTTILINQFNCTVYHQQQKIYDVLLHKIIEREEINHQNFVKILKNAITQKIPDVNVSEYIKIANTKKLSCKIFTKEEKLSSIGFAKLFKNVTNYNKKDIASIYVSIKKWEPKGYDNVSEHDEKHYVDEKEEEKVPDSEKTNDLQKQQFCTITDADNETAEFWLSSADWNMQTAINTYYALSGDKREEKSEDIVYNRGVYFWYWNQDARPTKAILVNKMYDDLKQEMLHKITKSQWDALMTECTAIKDADYVKAIVSNNNDKNMYGITLNDAISISHLLSIKLYTDFTTLCKRFSNAFILKKTQHSYETIESLTNRNCKYANWAKLLAETVQCYGKLAKKTRDYYRGVDAKFVFKKFIARFYVPLSTTTSFNIATNFAGGVGGIVLTFRKYNDGECVSCFNCALVSDFPHEKETLFFGGDAILQLISINQYYDKKWTHYAEYIEVIVLICKLIQGVTIDEQEISSDIIKAKMRNMIQYALDSKKYEIILPPYIQQLLNYHLKYLPNQICCSFETFVYEHQWLHPIFVKQIPSNTDIINIANLSNLFRNCNNFVIEMPDDRVIIMNDEFCKSLIDDMKDILNNNIELTFEWPNNNMPLENKRIINKYAKEFADVNTTTTCVNQSIILKMQKPKHYELWTTEEVIEWITSLGTEKSFISYRSTLEKKLSEYEINGGNLKQQEKHDISTWGIKKMSHRNLVYAEIQNLKNTKNKIQQKHYCLRKETVVNRCLVIFLGISEYEAANMANIECIKTEHTDFQTTFQQQFECVFKSNIDINEQWSSVNIQKYLQKIRDTVLIDGKDIKFNGLILYISGYANSHQLFCFPNGETLDFRKIKEIFSGHRHDKLNNLPKIFIQNCHRNAGCDSSARGNAQRKVSDYSIVIQNFSDQHATFSKYLTEYFSEHENESVTWPEIYEIMKQKLNKSTEKLQMISSDSYIEKVMFKFEF